MVQASTDLEVSQPGDAAEVEADEVARAVVGGGEAAEVAVAQGPTIARTPPTGAPGETWDSLGSGAGTVRQAIVDGRFGDAVQAAATALGITADWITYQYGFTGVTGPAGQAPRQGELGTATPCVASTVASPGPQDVRVFIRISTQVFSAHRLPAGADDAVRLLHTTLLHERVHASQFQSRGIAGLGPPNGDWREFTVGSPTELPVDEVQACCAEIENSQVTGMSGMDDMSGLLGYLLVNFRNYVDACRSGQTPDVSLANRALRAWLTGRRHNFRYLSSHAFWADAAALGITRARCERYYADPSFRSRGLGDACPHWYARWVALRRGNLDGALSTFQRAGVDASLVAEVQTHLREEERLLGTDDQHPPRPAPAQAPAGTPPSGDAGAADPSGGAPVPESPGTPSPPVAPGAPVQPTTPP
jgi:hypothetical protein